MENMSFAEQLRAKRSHKKISLRNFAKIVGVSPTYVSRIERGEVHPPVDEKIIKMAEALGENANRMMLLAGRVPAGIQEIIARNPAEVCGFLRKGPKDFTQRDWWDFN